MAKTTTANRPVKIVDLIRQRDPFEHIEVPKYPVEIKVIQKLKLLDISTILSGGETLASTASDIYDLVKNVAAAVA